MNKAHITMVWIYPIFMSHADNEEETERVITGSIKCGKRVTNTQK
jgi:hypothetical protein